jgi:hypothetical protein
MKTFLKNPANLLIVLIMVLTMAFPLSCSSDDDDGDPLSGLPGYEEYKERLKYYNPDDEEERCNKGVVEYVCELSKGIVAWYNPLKQGCEEIDYTCPSSGSCYGTYELGTIERCGRGAYVATPNGDARCQGGVLQRKCGDVWYNYETHDCDRRYDYNTDTYKDTLITLVPCGSKYYWPDSYTKCEGGVIKDKCGDAWYNYETEYCYYNYNSETQTEIRVVQPMVLCGSTYIRPEYNRCNNGVVEYRCGYDENITWYNGITQTCNRDTYTVKNKAKCSN